MEYGLPELCYIFYPPSWLMLVFNKRSSTSINIYTYTARQIFYIPLRYESKEINNRNKEIKLATPTKSGSHGQSINLWTMAAACCCNCSRCPHQLRVLNLGTLKFNQTCAQESTPWPANSYLTIGNIYTYLSGSTQDPRTSAFTKNVKTPRFRT